MSFNQTTMQSSETSRNCAIFHKLPCLGHEYVQVITSVKCAIGILLACENRRIFHQLLSAFSAAQSNRRKIRLFLQASILFICTEYSDAFSNILCSILKYCGFFLTSKAYTWGSSQLWSPHPLPPTPPPPTPLTTIPPWVVMFCWKSWAHFNLPARFPCLAEII